MGGGGGGEEDLHQGKQYSISKYIIGWCLYIKAGEEGSVVVSQAL